MKVVWHTVVVPKMFLRGALRGQSSWGRGIPKFTENDRNLHFFFGGGGRWEMSLQQGRRCPHAQSFAISGGALVCTQTQASK